jgi:hypothetical protein
VRRDLLYLAALIANTAAVFFVGWGEPTFLLAAIGPALVLRKGSFRPAFTAPALVLAPTIAVPLLLSALGADCPSEGMDYINECNARAQVAMGFLFGGILTLAVSVPALLLGLCLRAATRSLSWSRARCAGPSRRPPRA